MTIDFALEWIEQRVRARVDGDVACEIDRADDLARLRELRPLLIAASLLDDPFEVGVLARVLDMDERQLALPLEMAVQRGHLVSTRRNGVATCEFRDAALKLLARASIPSCTRAHLDRRAAEALGCASNARSCIVAASIARHWEVAGDRQLAVRWWRAAGERAAIEQAPVLAVAHLRQALAVCESGNDEVPPGEVLATLSQLGPLEAQLHGSGAEVVSAVYARCLEIAGQLDAATTTAGFDVLWGLVACILVHGRLETALELVGKLVRAAETNSDTSQLILAIRLAGLGHLLAGQLGAACTAFDKVARLYQPQQHARLRFRYASDQAAVALAHKSWAQAIAGMLEASEANSFAALDQTERLGHPHTSAHVMCVLAARAQILGLRDAAALMATAARALARQYRFSYWDTWAGFILGWHDASRHPQRAAAQLQQAIVAYHNSGAGQALPYAHLIHAGIAASMGDREGTIASVDAGLSIAVEHGVHLFDSALLQTKAQVLLPGPERRSLLEKGLEIAQQQGAQLFVDRIVAAMGKASC